MNDVIFKSNTCPSCITLENMLRANPLPIGVANIDTDPNARRLFDTTGSRAVPTAIVNGRVHIGLPNIVAALRAKYGRF